MAARSFVVCIVATEGAVIQQDEAIPPSFQQMMYEKESVVV